MLSSTDMSLSRLVLGCMRLTDDPNTASPDHVLRLIETCLDAGITTFDHADIYGSSAGPNRMHAVETLFGQALDMRPALRDGIEIVTKCGIVPTAGDQAAAVAHYNVSRDWIIGQVEGSRAALRTDRIDMLLLHRPDILMDPDETAGALNDLVAAGTVRAVGVSNFRPGTIDLLSPLLAQPLAAHQFAVSVLAPDALVDDTVAHAQRNGLVPMAWSPMGGKALFSSHEDRAHRLRRTLHDIGKEVGAAGLDQVALAWLLRHPAGIAPILGTTRPARVSASVAACDIHLSRPQWYAILEASLGEPVP